MGRLFSWLSVNVDAFLALLLAGIVSLLGIFGGTSDEVVQGSILAVLALVAFTIVRDRSQKNATDRAIRRGLESAQAGFGLLATRLDAVEQMASARILFGPEVGNALAEARQYTDRWTFKGGTGTFTRAVTLPRCVESARRERRAFVVRLEILDPTNEATCARYARLRQSFSPRPDGTGETWTTDRARKEAFATVLAACWYRSRYHLLDIEVGLSQTITTIRYDLSAHSLIITQEDPNVPALAIPSGRFLYDLFSTDLRTSLEQARRVAFERVVGIPVQEELDTHSVRELFDVLELPLPQTFTDADVAEIISKAISAKNPYPETSSA